MVKTLLRVIRYGAVKFELESIFYKDRYRCYKNNLGEFFDAAPPIVLILKFPYYLFGYIFKLLIIILWGIIALFLTRKYKERL